MSMIGTGFNLPATHAGCGVPALPAFGPRPTIGGGFPSFELPTTAPEGGANPFGDERFITTQMGGVILDKDGNPAGRVPEGSFVDTKDGKLYGPDSKPLALPEGGKVDFHDLPDLEELLKQVRGGGDDELRGPRFINSQGGGVIIGKDGAIAGRVPPGSFVDAKDGKVYGPDSKPIEVPEGAKVDFFDLPDLDVLLKEVRGGDDELVGPRFVNSPGGGVIIGKDGEVAGRIPPGSFVDAKDGKVYGPDSKPITVPEGAKVNFFDLPDLDDLMKQVRGGGTAAGKAFVDGQWGPGGVTDFKGGTQVGGAKGAGGCDMDHGGPAASKAGGPNAQIQSLMQQAQQAMSSLRPMMSPANYGATMGSGASTAVGGASGLGSIPSLQLSLNELVNTLRELALALQATTGGGKVTQTSTQASTTSKPTTESTPSTDSGSTSSNPITTSGSSTS